MILALGALAWCAHEHLGQAPALPCGPQVLAAQGLDEATLITDGAARWYAVPQDSYRLLISVLYRKLLE